MSTKTEILTKLEASLLTFNGASSVTHGDISIEYTSLSELTDAIKYYKILVADENGNLSKRVPVVTNGRRLR